MRAAVIPLKNLSHVKTRLAGYLSLEDRISLCLGMLNRLILLLSSAPEIDAVFVTTPDPRVQGYLDREFPHVHILRDPGHTTLNAAAKQAQHSLCVQGFSSMLFLLGDLPFLTSDDIYKACTLGHTHPIVLMPDRFEEGTNGMLLSPPNLVFPSFGQGSFSRHLSQARVSGLPCAVLRTAGWGADLDTWDDLCRARRLLPALTIVFAA